MSINKIKLQQIDANFSGLVGQYGSGYFASLGSFNSLSGASVPFSYISTGGFLYNTGNQSISGVKNFFTRPTFSGAGLAKLNEVVGLSSEDTIVGAKTFNGNLTIADNENSFSNATLDFIGCTFSLDPDSIDSISQSLDSRYVSTSGQQSVQGVKTFINGIKVGGGAGSGVLYSGQINPIYVDRATTNVDRYLTLVDDNINGFKNLRLNTGLFYNPQSNQLTCGVFSGNLSGNASTASSAAKLSGKNPIAKINGTGFDGSQDIVIFPSGLLDNSSNSDRYLLFTSSTGNGYKDVYFDDGVKVVPASNSIFASSFVGSFSGNSLNASAGGALNIGTLQSDGSIDFNFPAGSTDGYVMNSGSFYATPATGNSITSRNLGTTNSRWQNIFAGTSTIGSSDRNLKTEISEIPDEWLDAWQEVDYVRYKFKDAVAQKGASEARWHVGHIAQDIYEKFQNHGLNALQIGMLCYDKWDESVDRNGNIIPSGEIWSIRADECQFMEMALMRRSINRLKSGLLI